MIHFLALLVTSFISLNVISAPLPNINGMSRIGLLQCGGCYFTSKAHAEVIYKKAETECKDLNDVDSQVCFEALIKKNSAFAKFFVQRRCGCRPEANGYDHQDECK